VAELTVLDEKLAEVIGLAMAAKQVTKKVAGLVEDSRIKETIERMHEEAAQTEERGTEVADHLDGKKTAILEKARETKKEAEEMMSTYLGDDADGLDGIEFMTMAEAGEVGHLEILGTLADKAKAREIISFVDWATPIQQRHYELTLESGVRLAQQEDPNEEA
jgi:hypothetical protein